MDAGVGAAIACKNIGRKLATMTPMGVMSLPEGVAKVFLHYISCPCCSTSHRSRIRGRRGAQGGGRGGEDGVADPVATTRLRRHDDSSRSSHILTVSNDLSFAGGRCFSIGDNIWCRDAPRRTGNAQSRWIEDSSGSSSRTKDRWWLFRTPPIHQDGGATVRAHDFKRGPICQLQWGLSTSNEFISSSFWCMLSKAWWLIRRPP